MKRGFSISPPDKSLIRSTCPRDCYDSCGIIAIKRKGQITKILGDPEHDVSRGALCGKCAKAYNDVWRDPKARLRTPLRRIGSKGRGEFQPLGWDEAIELIAKRLKPLCRSDQSDTIWHCHYTGTNSLIAGQFPNRFFHAIGASEVDPDTICNQAGQIALSYLFGTASEGFDPRSIRDAKTVMLWGVNPSTSAPHAHRYWFEPSPAFKIVIDPVRHASAKAADLHLQPYPGSDAALAFGMLRSMQEQGILDKDYIQENCIGWPEIEKLLKDCPLGWAEAATGVAVETIQLAARHYAAGPSLLWLGQGLQRQRKGGNIVRAIGLLPAASGNIGKPGAGFYYLNGSGRKGIDGHYLQGTHLRQHPGRIVSHMDLPEWLADPRHAKAIFCWNINIAASNPAQDALRAALRRKELFTVVVDLFATDTTDFADIVLPAASFMEFDDIVSSYFHLTLGAQVKLMEPMGDSLPNQEIFRRLAKAFELEDPALYESDTEILNTLTRAAGIQGGFAELAECGTVPIFADPVIPFADGHFPTPSGKIELASEAAQKAGHPLTPLPLFDARPAKGYLRLLSPSSPQLMNSSYGNQNWLNDQSSQQILFIAPADAKRFAVNPGDLVIAKSTNGTIPVRIACLEDLPEGTALAHKSAWPKRNADGVNINFITHSEKADMGESTGIHSTEITLMPYPGTTVS